MLHSLAGLLLAAVLLGACGGPDPASTMDGMAPTSTAAPDPFALSRGSTAPDFGALALRGEPVELAALRGRPVWINFWATWCPPCKEEMPLMQQKYSQYGEGGLEILGVNMQEPEADVRAWVEGKFGWRFLIDSRGKIADLYNVVGLPMHVFVGRDGTVRDVHVGPLDEQRMDALLGELTSSGE